MRHPKVLYNPERHVFYARFTVNGKRRYFDLGPNLKGAKDKLGRLLVQTHKRIIMPLVRQPGQVQTIRQAFAAYVEHQKRNPRCSEANLRNISYHHKRFCEFADDLGTLAGDLPASAATPELLTGYVQTMETRGWSGGTLRHAAGAAKAAMRYCVRARLLQFNPWELVQLPSSKPAKEPRAMTREELAEILAGAKGRDRIALSLLYDSAARPSELSRATWSDYSSGQIVLKDHKTSGKTRRPRVLLFSETGQRILESLAQPKRARQKSPAPAGLLLTNSEGGRLSDMAWQRLVKRASAELPHLQWVTPYTFRHSRATHLAESGVDARTLADLLGNSVEIVLQRYVHPSPEHIKRAVEL